MADCIDLRLRVEAIEERLDRIERILTNLEFTLVDPWGCSALKGVELTKRGVRHYRTRQSPFEGVQDFPVNIARDVERALKGGAEE